MCRRYGRPLVAVPLDHLRLILDTQITTTDHAKTIIGLGERQHLAQQLRNFVHGCDAYGQQILLAETPIDDSLFPAISVVFPALRLRNNTTRIKELLGYGRSVRKIAKVLGYSSHIALNTYINKRGLHPAVKS